MPAIDLDYSQAKMATIAPKIELTMKLERIRGQDQLTNLADHHPLKKRRLLIYNSTLDEDFDCDSQHFQPLLNENKDTSSDDNNDLTNLNWLQDANLLQKVYSNTLDGTKNSGKQEEVPQSNNDPMSLDSSTALDSRSGTESQPKEHQKPPYSYSALIFMAIESSDTKSMMVRDIYKWIIHNFPYFDTAPNGWKNTIRHTLSLRKCFKKMEKPTAAGSSQSSSDPNSSDCESDKDSSDIKGGYWYVDPDYRANLQQQVSRNPMSVLSKRLERHRKPHSLAGICYAPLNYRVPIVDSALKLHKTKTPLVRVGNVLRKPFNQLANRGHNQVPVISSFSKQASAKAANLHGNGINHIRYPHASQIHNSPLPSLRAKVSSQVCQMPFKLQFKMNKQNMMTTRLCKSTSGFYTSQTIGNTVSVISVNQRPKEFAPMPSMTSKMSSISRVTRQHCSPGIPQCNPASPNKPCVDFNLLRDRKNLSPKIASQCFTSAQLAKGYKFSESTAVKCNEENWTRMSANQSVIMKTTKLKTLTNSSSPGNSVPNSSLTNEIHFDADNDDESLRDGAQALLNFASGGFHLNGFIKQDD